MRIKLAAKTISYHVYSWIWLNHIFGYHKLLGYGQNFMSRFKFPIQFPFKEQKFPSLESSYRFKLKETNIIY